MQQENLQQADKIYFNSGKLEGAYKQAILGITHGDNFTRLVADLVYHFAKAPHRDDHDKFNESAVKLGAMFHEYLKEYNKNQFPVPGNLMDYNQRDDVYHVLNLFSALRERHFLVKAVKDLPSIALRNINFKPENFDIRYLEYFYKDAAYKIRELVRTLKLLPNPDNYQDQETKKRKSELRDIILRKIFNSKNNLQKTVDTAKHFAYAFTGLSEDVEPADIIQKLEYLDADLVQNSNNLLVIKVNDQEAMQTLGCTSLWCFSRPGNQSDWEIYAPLGYVFVIFDFKKEPEEATFMMVYLPDSDAVYASTNVPLEEIGIEDTDKYLRQIGFDFSVLYDKKEPEPEKKKSIRQKQIAEPKVQMPRSNPNQMSIPFQEPEMRQVAELRIVIKKMIFESLYS